MTAALCKTLGRAGGGGTRQAGPRLGACGGQATDVGRGSGLSSVPKTWTLPLSFVPLHILADDAVFVETGTRGSRGDCSRHGRVPPSVTLGCVSVGSVGALSSAASAFLQADSEPAALREERSPSFEPGLQLLIK